MFVLLNATLEFVTDFNKDPGDSSLLESRFRIQHFGSYLSKVGKMTEITVLLSTLILVSVSFCLYSLVSQRISVPELKKQKPYNICFLISSLLLVPILLSSLFYYREFTLFSRLKLKLYDNILSSLFILVSLIFAILSQRLLSCISNPDHKFYNEVMINIKTFFLFMMNVCALLCKIYLYNCLDMFCLLCSSYYEPIIAEEKAISTEMVYLVNSCYIAYHFLFTSFFITLQYNLEYTSNTLQMNHSIEFFVDVTKK